MWRLLELAPSRSLKRIAVLTSGGDAPGMNAAIRAVVRTALARGVEVRGVQKGYSGLVESNWLAMDRASVANILQTGGTVLKTARCEAFLSPATRLDTAARLRGAGIEALVVIGGDGSLAGAHQFQQETGFPVIGVPGTIDNDVYGTDDSIGYDTAVNTALEAIDKLRDTATSHERVFLVEVMGRSSGFIAASVGVAGGAEIVLLPRQPADVDTICKVLQDSAARGKYSSLIIVAERDDPQLTPKLTAELSRRGYQSRAAILGHIQRGGSPSGHDRILASVLGAAAVDALLAGHSDVMVGVRGEELVLTPLAEVTANKKPQPLEYLSLIEQLAT